MARGQGVFAALAVRGSIGNTFTFSGWKGIQIIKKKPFPTNPKTPAQTTERNHFAAAVTSWHNIKLDAVDKRAWNLRAHLEALIMSGYNKFCQVFRKQGTANAWILLYDVKLNAAGANVTPAITADADCTITLSIVRGPSAGYSESMIGNADVQTVFTDIVSNSNDIVHFAAFDPGRIGESGLLRAIPTP